MSPRCPGHEQMIMNYLRRMGRYALSLFCVCLFLFTLYFHRAPLSKEQLQSLQESFYPGCLAGCAPGVDVVYSVVRGQQVRVFLTDLSPDIERAIRQSCCDSPYVVFLPVDYSIPPPARLTSAPEKSGVFCRFETQKQGANAPCRSAVFINFQPNMCCLRRRQGYRCKPIRPRRLPSADSANCRNWGTSH